MAAERELSEVRQASEQECAGLARERAIVVVPIAKVREAGEVCERVHERGEGVQTGAGESEIAQAYEPAQGVRVSGRDTQVQRDQVAQLADSGRNREERVPACDLEEGQSCQETNVVRDRTLHKARVEVERAQLCGSTDSRRHGGGLDGEGAQRGQPTDL